eukprot:jgi/Phyca11/98941/e_gw1.3.1180.1
MPTKKPTKNGISSSKEFKTLCITVAKSCKIRVSDEAIRHLRLTMNTTVASSSLLPEAIQVVFTSLAERKIQRAKLGDIREWLAPPAVDSDEEDGDEDSEGEKIHYVRKILNWKRVKGKTVSNYPTHNYLLTSLKSDLVPPLRSEQVGGRRFYGMDYEVYYD